MSEKGVRSRIAEIDKILASQRNGAEDLDETGMSSFEIGHSRLTWTNLETGRKSNTGIGRQSVEVGEVGFSDGRTCVILRRTRKGKSVKQVTKISLIDLADLAEANDMDTLVGKIEAVVLRAYGSSWKAKREEKVSAESIDHYDDFGAFG